MDDKRARVVRKIYQLTLAIPGEELGSLIRGDAYTLVYKYIRGNTNFLSPANDDPYKSTATVHTLVCHFVLQDVWTTGAFTVLKMTEPEVYGCTQEDDMERMRVFLVLSKNEFEFPTSTAGRDVRVFKRAELEDALKIK